MFLPGVTRPRWGSIVRIFKEGDTMETRLYELELDKLEKDIRRMNACADERELYHSWLFATKRLDRVYQHNYERIQDMRFPGALMDAKDKKVQDG